jgi:hypothetical protein
VISALRSFEAFVRCSEDQQKEKNEELKENDDERRRKTTRKLTRKEDEDRKRMVSDVTMSHPKRRNTNALRRSREQTMK